MLNNHVESKQKYTDYKEKKWPLLVLFLYNLHVYIFLWWVFKPYCIQNHVRGNSATKKVVCMLLFLVRITSSKGFTEVSKTYLENSSLLTPPTLFNHNYGCCLICCIWFTWLGVYFFFSYFQKYFLNINVYQIKIGRR